MNDKNQPLNIDPVFLTDLVKEAGQQALGFFGNVKPQYKADRSLVSEADRKIETFLIKHLTEKYPNTTILGEEHGSNDVKSDHMWLLDPIDGTSAFLSKLPVWGVSIGYMYKTQAIAGVFYLPITDDLFLATPQIAHWNNTPISKSTPTVVDAETTLIVPSNAHRRYKIAFIGKTRNFGSAAAHICYVATGQAIGALLGYVNLWDVAGVLPLLHAAGGDLYTLQGQPLNLADFLKNHKSPKAVLVSPAWYSHTLVNQVIANK